MEQARGRRQVSENGERKFLARDIDDAAPAKSDDDEPEGEEGESPDREVFGFITLHARDDEFNFADRDVDYPETWLDFDAAGNPRIKSHYRSARAREVTIAPNGKEGSGARAWFIPGRFRFCLRCGATHSTSARDRTRLASLSAEGRSSATTVLVSSALRWMHGNDFIFVSLTRHSWARSTPRRTRACAAMNSGWPNSVLSASTASSCVASGSARTAASRA